MKKLVVLCLLLVLMQNAYAGWGDFLDVIKQAASSGSNTSSQTQPSNRTPNQDEQQLLDLLIIAKTKKSEFDMSEPLIGKNIDQTFRLTRQDGSITFNNCLTNDLIRKYGTPSEELAEILLANNQPGLFAINSVYATNGIALISSVANIQVETLLNAMGSKLDIQKKCSDDQPTDLAWTSANTSEIIVVPRFLLSFILQTNSYASLNDFELISTISYPQLKSSSLVLQEQLKKEAAEITNLAQLYQTKSQKEDKSSIGSLVISLNDYGNKNQKVCTLNYNEDDAMSVIGYRELGKRFLTNDILNMLNQNKMGLDTADKAFDITYANINNAYVDITTHKENCNIYIDFPSNIVVLKNALEKDGYRVAYGKLLSAQEMQTNYAQKRGYHSKAEYNLAVKISANLDQIKKLRHYDANSSDAVAKIITEITNIKYSEKNDIETVLSYLKDKNEATKNKVSILVERDNRIANEKKAKEIALKEEQKRIAEYIKTYPYEATISCGFANQHLNAAACFTRGQYGVDTELEVNNGGSYKMYKAWELQSAGTEHYGEGLIIALKKNFFIRAQNTNDSLTLTLTIKESGSGKVIYQKSAGKFGVVSFQK